MIPITTNEQPTVTKATVLGQNCATCKFSYLYVPQVELRCDKKSEQGRFYWGDNWLLEEPPHTPFGDSVCPLWEE